MAWIFPVVGDWVYSWFFGDKDSEGNVHHGLDIATMGISGLAIVAPEDMHIINSGWSDAGYGNFVMAEDANGLTLIFGHMLDRPLVEMGDDIKAGDPLGYVGSTGNSSGPHLHFEVRQNGTPIDPLPFLDDSIEPPDVPPNPEPGNPNPPNPSIPGLGNLNSISDTLKAMATWITSIDYKKIFINSAVVIVGIVILAIGLIALTKQAEVSSIVSGISAVVKSDTESTSEPAPAEA